MFDVCRRGTLQLPQQAVALFRWEAAGNTIDIVDKVIGEVKRAKLPEVSAHALD